MDWQPPEPRLIRNLLNHDVLADMVLIRSGQRALWVLVALLLIGSLRGDVPDEEDYVEEGGDYESGGQGDPAYEQYAERLQQQLESLRKEHDVNPRPLPSGHWRCLVFAKWGGFV